MCSGQLGLGRHVVTPNVIIFQYLSRFNVIHPGMEMDLIFVEFSSNNWVSPQVLDLGEDVFLNSGMQQVFTFKMLVVLQHRLASSFSMLEPFVHKWHIFG